MRPSRMMKKIWIHLQGFIRIGSELWTRWNKEGTIADDQNH